MGANKDFNNPPSYWGIDGIQELTDVIYYRINQTADGRIEMPTFWHWCVAHLQWMAQGSEFHTLITEDPLEMQPSLLWDCCGLHGFVRGGKWIQA